MKPAACGAQPASAFVNFWQVSAAEGNPSQVSGKAIRADLIGSDTCTALGITISSSSPALALCRKLVQAGYNPLTPLEVYRGEILTLRVRSIGEGGRLETNGEGTGFRRRASRTQPRSLRQSRRRVRRQGPRHDETAAQYQRAGCAR